jgi:photosystem II stability/assembly factor-like uncharacterized protein
MKKFYLLLLLATLCAASPAQTFLRKKTAEEISFRQMQRDFHDWKSSRNLLTEKHWKHFKRWEMETQLHTNGRGEPDGQKDYIDAAIRVASEKEASSLFKSNTAAWYPVGPFNLPTNQTGYMENGMGRINCMTFHPFNPASYIIGVAQGGAWKTVNNGQSWTPLTDNLPITRISDICIDPNDTNTMYISVCDFEYIGFGLFLNGRKRNTHYGLGVYKTTDGGNTWNPTGLSFQMTQGDASLIRRVLVNPANSSNLIACGVSGMYISNNAGTTWTKTLDSLFWDLQQASSSPSTLYAASGWVQNSNTGYANIYKSTNFGNSWTLLNTGIPMQNAVQRVKLAVAPSDNNYVYAITVDTQNGLYAVYKSTNAGSTWTQINPGVNLLEGGDGTGPGGQGNYDLGFCVSPTNRDLLYVGGVNLWGSSDGGQTWGPVAEWTTSNGPTIHGDIHYITTQPLTGNYFVCSDGGVYRTNNMVISSWGVGAWPTAWTKINNGLNITSFYRLSSSKNVSGLLMAGAQDNASFFFDGAGWNTVIGGDGMDNYIDPSNNANVYGSSQYGYFDWSTDGGVTFGWMGPNVNGENAEWTTPIVGDDNTAGTLYCGFTNVTKSADEGMTWSAISSFPVNFSYDNEISAMAVANTDPNVLYVAKRVRYEFSVPGSVYHTANGGSTWTDITAGLPDSLYYTSVAINETDANAACVSMAGFSAGNKVFCTSNAGASWQNITYNLPNLPVNCVKYVPGANMLMAATDVGIYTLPNGGNTWTSQSTGLPNVILSDIEFNVPANKIYLSTFGRGIWATDYSLFTSVADPKQADPYTLFPTVNSGSFTLVAGSSGRSEVEIVNTNGQKVYSASLVGKERYELELKLAPGLYFAKIKGEKSQGIKRFIVQ